MKHPGKRFPYNFMHLHNVLPQGPALVTMLDCSRFGITVPEFGASLQEYSNGDEDILKMSTFDRSVRQDQREKVYRYLRDRGAVHGWELDGYFIRLVTQTLGIFCSAIVARQSAAIRY